MVSMAKQPHHPEQHHRGGADLRLLAWRTLRIEPGIFEVWKQREEDGVYMPGMSMLANTRGTGRHVGTIYRASTRWLATPNLTLDLDLKYYDVGTAIKEAGGEDSSFVSVRATFRL